MISLVLVRVPISFDLGQLAGLLKAGQVQLVVQALPNHNCINGNSRPEEFSGMEARVALCKFNSSPSQFAGRGRANVIVFEYTDDIRH